MKNESENQLKTWKDLKGKLKYKSDLEKEVVSEMARLVSNIIRERKKQNLSQRDLAFKAGITQAQVGRLETSSSVPSIETIMKVTLALGLKLELEGSENATTATHV